MRFPSAVVAVAALVAGGARANMDFDLDSAPPDCRSMCEPVGQLSDACEADLGGDNTDLAEEQLAAQCFCTNESFPVAQVAALCYDCIRQAVEAAGGDDGTAPAVQVKRQAVDGSDCLTDDQCSSGFCAESTENGRPGNVCQTPGEVQEPDENEEPVPVGTPIGAPCDSNEECVTGLCAATVGSDGTICLVPSGNGGGGQQEDDNGEEQGGQAVNGSDCLTDDQCSSGFCGETTENGRPGNVCQPRPDSPAPPATDDSPPAAPSTVEPPPAAPTTVDSPPAAPTTIAPPTTSAAVSNPGSFITIVPPASTASPSTTALPGVNVDLASWEDALSRMGDIVGSCQFETTSYSPDATSLLQEVNVSAVQPTATDQLTTTIAPGPLPTGADGNNNNNNNHPDGGRIVVVGDSAASALSSPFYLAGAIVAGIMALL